MIYCGLALDFWLFGVLGISHPLLNERAGSPKPQSQSSNSGKIRDFSIRMGWWFILCSHKTIMHLPLFQNQQPRQLVSIGLEKTGRTATTGSGALLHPPQKLSCRTYCKMLTEHCRVHWERDEKSADLRLPVQLLASVSQAHSLTQSPTCPVSLCLDPL